MHVSVVIPVYNPGRDIDRCIASLLGQTLPPSDFEAIFVDDGSTDETPARLDALAAEHPHVRVIHIPNSGWPGRPRNVGIESATGTFVQLLDQDDHLAPDALRRLVEMGDRNRSDIVIGKVTSDFRGVPHGLFVRDREACTIHDAPLIDSLTPHKMFRRSFIQEHGIRFPEGPYILEDQLFMVRCYFRAEVVSILASYPCYFYNERSHGANTASRTIDPPVYYRNLREVVDVVVANTEPGDFRDRLLRRSYRVEMLGRLGEPSFQAHPPDLQASLVTQVRGLALDHMRGPVHAGLAPALRLRSAIILGDGDAQADDIAELARRAARVDTKAVLEGVAWRRGRLEVDLSITTRDDDGHRPLRLLRRGERTLLDPGLTDGLLADPLDVTDDLESFRVWVTLRNRIDLVEWRASSQRTVGFVDEPAGPDGERWLHPVVRATAAIDPGAIAAGRPLGDGTWDVRIRATLLGFDRRIGVQVRDRRTMATVLPAWLEAGGLIVRPTVGDDGGLRLDIGAGTLQEVVRSVEPRPSGGRMLEVALPLASGSIARRPVTATLATGARERPLEATLHARADRLHVAVRLGWRPGLTRRRAALTISLDGPDGPAIPVGTVVTSPDGRSFLEHGRRVSLVASARHHLVAIVRSLARRMPPLVKRAGRRLVRPGDGWSARVRRR